MLLVIAGLQCHLHKHQQRRMNDATNNHNCVTILLTKKQHLVPSAHINLRTPT